MPTTPRVVRFSEPLAAVLALLATFACFSFEGCHQLRACYDSLCEDVPAGGAANEATSGATNGGGPDDDGGSIDGGAPFRPDTTEGGAAGDSSGGAGGEAYGVCPVPFADCDESTLTACETDLSRDVQHCGKCGARCSGFCAAGECHAFENIVPSSSGIALGGIGMAEDAVYALVNAPDFTSRQLMRYDKKAGTTATLVMSSQSLGQVLVAPTRVYLYGAPYGSLDEDVTRVEDGNLLQPDALKASWLALVGDELYAAGAAGIVARREGETSLRSVALPDGLSLPGAQLRLASAGRHLVLLAMTGGRYTVYRLDTSAADVDWQVLGEAAGIPLRVRASTNAAYVLTSADLESTTYSQQLQEYGFNGKARQLASGTDYSDFALDATGHVYLTLSGSEYGLHVLALARPEDVSSFSLSISLVSIELDGEYLYVSSGYDFGLGRLPVLKF